MLVTIDAGVVRLLNIVVFMASFVVWPEGPPVMRVFACIGLTLVLLLVFGHEVYIVKSKK